MVLGLEFRGQEGDVRGGRGRGGRRPGGGGSGSGREERRGDGEDPESLAETFVLLNVERVSQVRREQLEGQNGLARGRPRFDGGCRCGRILKRRKCLVGLCVDCQRV